MEGLPTHVLKLGVVVYYTLIGAAESGFQTPFLLIIHYFGKKLSIISLQV